MKWSYKYSFGETRYMQSRKLSRKIEKYIYFSVFQMAKTSEKFKLHIFSYIYFKLYYISPEKKYYITAVSNTYIMPVIQYIAKKNILTNKSYINM